LSRLDSRRRNRLSCNFSLRIESKT
jgi:hypothetical protein